MNDRGGQKWNRMRTEADAAEDRSGIRICPQVQKRMEIADFWSAYEPDRACFYGEIRKKGELLSVSVHI